jgi:hypothetical protein
VAEVCQALRDDARPALRAAARRRPASTTRHRASGCTSSTT